MTAANSDLMHKLGSCCRFPKAHIFHGVSIWSFMVLYRTYRCLPTSHLCFSFNLYNSQYKSSINLQNNIFSDFEWKTASASSWQRLYCLLWDWTVFYVHSIKILQYKVGCQSQCLLFLSQTLTNISILFWQLYRYLIHPFQFFHSH